MRFRRLAADIVSAGSVQKLDIMTSDGLLGGSGQADMKAGAQPMSAVIGSISLIQGKLRNFRYVALVKLAAQVGTQKLMSDLQDSEIARFFVVLPDPVVSTTRVSSLGSQAVKRIRRLDKSSSTLRATQVSVWKSDQEQDQSLFRHAG